MSDDLADDCAAASAAYVLNCVLPTLAALPAPERFERLKSCFEACIAALLDGMRGWEPSDN